MKQVRPLLLGILFVILLPPVVMVTAAPTKTAAPAQQGMDMKGMFGGNGNLEADSIEMEQGKEGKLDMLIAKRNVTLVSDKMNVTCDLLTYYVGRDRMIATGRPVHIKQEDIKATCETFEYSPNDGKATLKGNPYILQKTPEGKWYGLSGDIVKMNKLPDGRQSVIIEPGGVKRAKIKFSDPGGDGSKPTDASAQGVKPATFTMETDQPAKSEKKPAKPVADPESVDSGKVDKIPEPTIGGE